jgi:hypothetical protein
MPILQVGEYSPINAPSVGVIPQPHVSALGGESYKYVAKGGRKSRLSKKQQRRTKKAKQNRRSRRTRSNR